MNAQESYKGQTALMWAAAERHPDVVKLLLEHGADWKVLSSDHETKMPKLSAASSVTPMARGGSRLLPSARAKAHESARAMLDAGVDINQLDVDKTSALVVSIVNKKYSFAKFMLDRGADVNIAGGHGLHGPVRAHRYPERGLRRASGSKDRGSAADPRSRQRPARVPAELDGTLTTSIPAKAA